MRRRASSAGVLGEGTPRAILVGLVKRERVLNAESIARLADGSGHSPPPLTDAERARLTSASLDGAPLHVLGDYPEWLDPYLATVFGEERAEEGAALALRAPIDLRVNTLKGERDEALGELSELSPYPTRWSPHGIRIKPEPNKKAPAIHAEPAYIKGLIEIQDEGSQLAALFANAKPGEQVVDLCAGGGGKTLALAAAMQNKGQLYAHDDDKRRLAPIHARLERAGVRNAQIRTPKSHGDVLSDLEGQCDLVLIDAPCTGIGTWRRNPDAKWRVRPGALEVRMKEQVEVLDRGATLVKAGGRIAYITCSVLDEENGGQVRAFVGRHPEFSVEKPMAVTNLLGERAYLFQRAAKLTEEGALMTPRRTDTDGFFVSVLKRS
jgi:16S rRNA (cytosine967-C5)-methyltransferase